MELILKDGTRKPVCGDCHKAVNGMRRGRKTCDGCRAARKARREADRADFSSLIASARAEASIGQGQKAREVEEYEIDTAAIEALRIWSGAAGAMGNAGRQE